MRWGTTTSVIHVDCGGPADPDPNYPYNHCNISDASPAYQGWNPISLRMIKGTAAGDLLPYRGNSTEAGTRWTSDYTWRAIYNRLGAPLLPPPPAPRSAGAARGLPSCLAACAHANGTGRSCIPPFSCRTRRRKPRPRTGVSKSGDLTTWNFALRRAKRIADSNDSRRSHAHRGRRARNRYTPSWMKSRKPSTP